MPNVELTSTTGETVMLYDLMEGYNKVIISLETSWCSDCHRQDAKYNQMYEDGTIPSDILVIPVYTSYSKEDDPEKQADLNSTNEYLNEMGYEYPAYYDTNDELWDAFNAYGTPTNIVLDKNARIKAITLEYDSDILMLPNLEDETYL